MGQEYISFGTDSVAIMNALKGQEKYIEVKREEDYALIRIKYYAYVCERL